MAEAGKLDKRLIASIALAVVGLAMLIAGSVMLGVGISKANKKSSCAPCQNTCPVCPDCPTLAPSAVFTTSYSQSIQYTQTLSDPNSNDFKTASTALSQNISALLNAPVPAVASVLATAPGTTVTINSFQPSITGQGVNFYASILFPYNGMNATSVQQQLNTVYPTSANVSPTSSCYSLVPPPGQSTTASVPVTTTTVTMPPLPDGVACDIYGQKTLIVFVVDVAVPNDGNLEGKLNTTRTFLNNYDQWIGLHDRTNWGGVQFQFVTYHGVQSQAATSGVCSDDECWHAEVSALRAGLVNPQNNPNHYLSMGLHQVDNTVKITPGQANSLIIISDGFGINDQEAISVANSLKFQKNFQIGAFLASSSAIAQNQMAQVVTNAGYLYSEGDMSWLNNLGVDMTMALWSCQAPYPPTTQSTVPFTRPMVKTTTMTTTTRPPVTTPSGPVPIPNCAVDVVFLVDESQSMILNGFSQSITYVKALSSQLASLNNNTRFSLVTFNSIVVFQSQTYNDYDTFISSISNISISSGATDFIVGFTAARTLISSQSRYATDGIRSVLIFLSDGMDNNQTPISNVQAVGHDLRSTYQTEIIALGLSENNVKQTMTKQAIDYGAADTYVQSQYIDVPTYDQVTSPMTQNQTLVAITCKMTAKTCSSDFVFVIEVSEAEEATNIEIQKQAVNGLISHYSKLIGANAGEVSLVYFSSPNGFNSNENNRSGILYQLVDDPNAAINQLAPKTFAQGGASDINLAMNLVLNVLTSDQDNNDQMVIFFARGAYADAPNCCSDPSVSAAAVRSKATVQGVSIGNFPDINTLNNLTGSAAVDGNALIVQNNGVVDISSSAAAIQKALIPLIDNHLNSVYCPPLPTLVTPCAQYDDVVIIMHANSQANWDIMKQFVNQLVIPALTGPLSNFDRSGTNVRIGIISYFGQEAHMVVQLHDNTATLAIATAINGSAFIGSTETNALSQGYKYASSQYLYARTQATPTILVITDNVDNDDYDSAKLQRSRLPANSFVYGIRVGDINGVPITGQDDGVVVTDIQQLNPVNTRSSISFANQAANGVCKYIPITTPAIPTTPTPKPTPAPIPQVKARNMWPDVTVLIDASQQDSSLYESQRIFLRKTFLNQFRIGDGYSRFSVATYNNATNIVCRFADIANYWELESCLGSQISYSNVVTPGVTTRDVNQALVSVMNQVYMANFTGYKPLKENYLYVLTNGKSSSNFYASSTALKNMGIHVIGIDISSTGGMTPTELTDFGPDSFKVPGWQNSTINDQLSQEIVAQITNKPKPMYSDLFSDFYFIVDNSLSQTADIPNIQQFITKFVDQLTVSPHRSRVSIVPFSASVTTSLPLTDNSQAVTDFMTQWQQQGPGAAASNIGSAITNVVLQAMSGARFKTANVIYLIGANSTTGADTASDLTNTIGVTPYVLQYNPLLTYASLLSGSEPVYQIQGSGNLMNWAETQYPAYSNGKNPMNQFFNRILEVEEAQDQANFPMKEIAADVIIFLDETGLSQDDFASVKQYLINFTSQFTVSRQDTQIALQTFGEQIIPEGGWHFYESVSNDAINQKINSLTLHPTPANASADLSGAVDQALMYFLQTQNGWRDDATTYSIIITNAANFANVGNTTSVQDRLKALSYVYAMSLNGGFSSYVFDFVNTGVYQVVDTPKSLTTGSDADVIINSAISNSYKSVVYPPPIPLSQVKADFIFLIDNTNMTNPNQVKNFLLKIIPTMAPFGYWSRMAVLNYNSQGVIESTSWTLTTFSNPQDLQTGIRNMQFSNDMGVPDLGSAVAYFSAAPSLFGINSCSPVFVTGIFSSSSINTELSQTLMNNVNLNYFTFALQYGSSSNSVAFDYVKQFSGSDYAEDFVYTPDLSYYDTSNNNDFHPYNAYIQSQYQAWLNSNSC